MPLVTTRFSERSDGELPGMHNLESPGGVEHKDRYRSVVVRAKFSGRYYIVNQKLRSDHIQLNGDSIYSVMTINASILFLYGLVNVPTLRSRPM